MILCKTFVLIIEEYLVEENTEDIDVLFAIDINGMSDEEVNKEEVIAISIKVINKKSHTL